MTQHRKPVRSITILGKRYRFRLMDGRKMPDVFGECEDPKAAGKEIRIRKALLKHPREFVETLIHEMLHGADFSRKEDWISQLADDLERALHRFGFGLTQE